MDYVLSIATVGVCTGVAFLLRQRFEPSTFAMLYLLGVLVVAMKCRRPAAILNALLSVTAFYYFCVPFHDSFVLEDSNYVLTLIVMLVVALVISGLTFKIRSQAGDILKTQIAVESERARNSFLSAVSHDIKTPLSSIYGAATSLLEEDTRIARSQQRELIQSIADEAERLNQLVTKLIDMTKLDAGADINRNWHPLEEIIVASITNTKKLLQNRTVTTNISSDLPLIFADDLLLEQLFINLLENAAKYTPDDTNISISAMKHQGNIITFVRDEGPGFPIGEEEQVFEKFFRGKTAGIRGAGLGLAICRSITDLHNGTISASNSNSGGAIVTVELPIGGTPPPFEVLAEESLR
jgi:K+-sensing histidine kinase KdpD